MLVGSAAAGDKARRAPHFPFLKHFSGKMQVVPPLPFLAADQQTAALRRIHHSTVNATPDAAANDSQFDSQIVDLGGGKLLAVFEDSGEFDGDQGNDPDHYTGYSWSDNNGLSWNDSGHLPDTATGDYGRPSLAADSTTGEVYLAESDLGGAAPTKIMVFKSTDSGHTFGAPVTGSPGVTQTPVFPSIAVNNFSGGAQGRIYLCWTQYSDPNDGTTGRIMFSRSTDHGASFSPNAGTLISIGGGNCAVALGPSNRVYIFYYRGGAAGGIGGDNKLFVKKSADGGLSFGAAVQVADLKTTSAFGDLTVAGAYVPTLPIIAINPVAARPFMYVVFNDDPAPLGGTDIADTYYVRSTDTGATWSAPVRINDQTAGDQFFPAIAFAKGGERLLFTYNSRDSTTGLYHRRGRVGVLNASGAVVMNQSFQLSPESPFVHGADPYEFGYSGEYEGSAGGTGVISTLWSDTRLGNSFHLNQPDIRFAQIAVPPPSTNLAVTVTPSPASTKLGENSVVTVKVTATGGAANDAFVSITTPFGLQFRAGGTWNRQCSLIANHTGCSLGPIPAGGSRTVELIVKGIYAPGTRTVTATATTSSNETTPANNTAQANIVVSGAGTTVRNFSSGNIAAVIPDNTPTGTVFGIDVPNEGIGVQATVGVRLNHAYDSDLEMYLVSPLGTVVPLSIQHGGDGDNYGSGANSCAGTKTLFTDLAATSISQGSPPFAGQFKPDSPIASALGEPSDGRWRLAFRDIAAPDFGTIGCLTFSLTVAN